MLYGVHATVRNFSHFSDMGALEFEFIFVPLQANKLLNIFVMEQRSTSESWSRIACRYLGKTVGLVSLCFVLATGAYAQGVTAEQKERQRSASS